MSKNGEKLIRSTIDGVVLAGGQGTRFGGHDKGWLQYAGRSLIETAITRFSPQVANLFISANRNLEAYRALGYPVLSDDEQIAGDQLYQGPLMGIYSAIKECRSGWLACIPCDMPAVPLDLVQHLYDGLAGRQAAFITDGQQAHYLCCLLKQSLESDLLAYLAAGRRAVKYFLGEVDAVELSYPADVSTFANLNTWEQLSTEVESSCVDNAK